MKSQTKRILFTLVACIAFAAVSQAQDTSTMKKGGAANPVPPAGSTSTATTAKKSPEDWDSHMAKMQQMIPKLQQKESKAKDPEMKADLQNLITRMQQVSDEYNAMKNNPSLSEAQQKESKDKIQADMKEVRKLHDDMKAKYGDDLGGKNTGEHPQQPVQEQQKEPGSKRNL